MYFIPHVSSPGDVPDALAAAHIPYKASSDEPRGIWPPSGPWNVARARARTSVAVGNGMLASPRDAAENAMAPHQSLLPSARASVYILSARELVALRDFLPPRFKRCKVKMLTLGALALCLVAVDAQRIVLSNDDGWAVAQIRAEYDALRDAGYDVILSAPAENGSGRGALSIPALPRLTPCQFNSCDAPTGPTGNNASDTRQNWINALPADGAEYGIETLAPKFWNAKPDLLVSGPNVGKNTGLAVFFSGTVGAAGKAVQLGVPAIAFSGSDKSTKQEAWTALSSSSPSVAAAKAYAQLTTQLLDVVFDQPAASPAYLPADTTLNVNFPEITDACGADNVQWVLTRVLPVLIGSPDVEVCGNGGRLPTDGDVLDKGCFASVSVIKPTSKTDANKEAQAGVYQRLKGINWACA